MFKQLVFNKQLEIPQATKIIFVADMFIEQYVGGAELTTEALISSSPLNIFKLHSKDVTAELIAKNVDKFWIFGNFSGLNPQFIPTIVGNLNYSVLEYDFKYCSFRSPEKHLAERGSPCDCHNQMTGKMISAFYLGAKTLFWMSEKQKERYHRMFPFLVEQQNVVLSSVFDKETLGTISLLREQKKEEERKGWIVLGSSSWIKGATDAEDWCKKNNKEYEVVWNVSYKDMLAKLASAEGVVYLPRGADTCPRFVIEAKLLGCKLHLNDYVLHRDEEWFATNDIQAINDYLFVAPELFWKMIVNQINYKPTISGYLTTFNCIKQQYPYEQCIQSMLSFCDEVIVLDGGSNDGTYERLREMSKVDDKLKISQHVRDWNAKRASLFDGMQKAEARSLCTSEFCWQMDADEVIHEDDAQKIIDLAKKFPKNVDIAALPVIEFWGQTTKVRVDINLSKWRLSRNKKNITHGVPVELRAYDEDGELYAKQGTDGCCMIYSNTGERAQFVSFITPEIENARRVACSGNQETLQQIEQWFNQVVANLPSVYHYSWIDFKRKIHLYRDTWQKHWLSLYNMNVEDTAENNMFFDVPWSQVTEKMIDEKCNELAQTGGHIFHTKFDLNKRTPWIKINQFPPKIMMT